MTVRLRPHHLLCMLTYVGKGYSPAFLANYDAIAERLSMGEDIGVVAGPDDICAPLLGESEPHCRRDSVVERDRKAAVAVGALLAMAVAPGARLRLDASQVATLREAFAAGSVRAACQGCVWAGLCSAVAGAGYEGTRLR